MKQPAFDCRIGDSLIKGNRFFHRELKDRQIPHRYMEYEGAHDWFCWHAHVSASLLFFEEILRDGQKPTPASGSQMPPGFPSKCNIEMNQFVR